MLFLRLWEVSGSAKWAYKRNYNNSTLRWISAMNFLAEGTSRKIRKLNKIYRSSVYSQRGCRFAKLAVNKNATRDRVRQIVAERIPA